MKIDLDKMKVMTIEQECQASIHIEDNMKVEHVKSMKYLAVQIQWSGKLGAK